MKKGRSRPDSAIHLLWPFVWYHTIENHSHFQRNIENVAQDQYAGGLITRPCRFMILRNVFKIGSVVLFAMAHSARVNDRIIPKHTRRPIEKPQIKERVRSCCLMLLKLSFGFSIRNMPLITNTRSISSQNPPSVFATGPPKITIYLSPYQKDSGTLILRHIGSDGSVTESAVTTSTANPIFNH